MRKLLAITLAALMLFATPVVAVDMTRPNYAGDDVDDPYIHEERMDVDTHDRSEMSSVTQFYDDDGNVQTAPVSYNDSIDHRAGVHFDKVDADAYTKFPRDEDYSSVNASHWSVAGTNSSKLTVSQQDGTTAENVQAIGFATDGSMASGDDAHAAFTNVSITSDAEKRVPQIGLNVNSIDAGSTVRVEFVDSDGDTKQFIVDSSANASDDHVIATEAGTGYFAQERLSDLATNGSGDGTFAEVQEVRVEVVDGDADVTVYALDSERKSFVDLGTRLEDTDDDDALEEIAIEDVESPGLVKLDELSTLGSAFDAAIVNDLAVYGLEWRASDLEDSENYDYTASDAESYVGYEHKVESYERIRVTQAIDLSHNGLELRQEQATVDERYKRLEVAEGTSDTAFDDVDSWSSYSAQSEGDTIVIDDTVQPGTNYDLHRIVVYTDDEIDDVVSSSGGGGSGASSGGLGNIPLIGGVLVALLGVFRKITG